jgi:membrane fusion protein (multidrug efflux system)
MKNCLSFGTVAAVMALLQGSAFAQEWHEGLCVASVDASLSFPIPGVLARIHLKEGELVKEGQVILELESEIESLEVERQKLAVEAARKDYERTKKAFDQGGSVRAEEMEQKEAIWKIAQVEQRQAESQLRRRQLTSPADGVVMDLFDLDRGEAVSANAPAARIVNTGACRFTAYVKGESAHGFTKGSAVEIVFNGTGSEVAVAGTVEFVAPAIEAASGLQEVRAVIDNKDGKITAGVMGRMRLKAK